MSSSPINAPADAVATRLSALIALVMVAVIVVGATAWDARSQAQQARTELAQLQHQTAELDQRVTVAARALAQVSNGVSAVDGRVDRLQRTLFGRLPPSSLRTDVVGDLEHCLASIASYLDGHARFFICPYF